MKSHAVGMRMSELLDIRGIRAAIGKPPLPPICAMLLGQGAEDGKLMQGPAFCDAKLLKVGIPLKTRSQQLERLLFKAKHAVSIDMPIFVERATQRGESL